MLFDDRASMWYHKVTSGSRAEMLSARAGRSQDEEFEEVGRSNAKSTTPNNGGDLVVNAPPDREPVQSCVLAVVCDSSCLIYL